MTRPMTRVRIGPILVAVVLTGLLLWMVAATADILLLLFLAILVALYLGAVRDYLVRRLRLPETGGLLDGRGRDRIAAGVGLLWLLVPPRAHPDAGADRARFPARWTALGRLGRRGR